MTKVIDQYTSDPPLLHEALNEQDMELEALRKQNLEQAAQIEMLRDALVEARGYLDRLTQDGVRERCDKALSATPAQALEAFAAKVREQCVERLSINHFVTGASYHSAVAAIRNLK